jgi:hypothetical protein
MLQVCRPIFFVVSLNMQDGFIMWMGVSCRRKQGLGMPIILSFIRIIVVGQDSE